MFPFGDGGFHPEIPLKAKPGKQPVEIPESSDPSEETKYKTSVSLREYYAYKFMIRPSEGYTFNHLSSYTIVIFC